MGRHVRLHCDEKTRIIRTIRTELLLLRPFRESDYDDLIEFLFRLKDDEFEGYPGITFENGRKHLKYRLGSEEFYAIELTGTGKVIGNICCGNRSFAAKEVGFIINKRYQRKGHTTEALSAVIAQAFQEDAHRVYAEYDPGNAPSGFCAYGRLSGATAAPAPRRHLSNTCIRRRDMTFALTVERQDRKRWLKGSWASCKMFEMILDYIGNMVLTEGFAFTEKQYGNKISIQEIGQ